MKQLILILMFCCLSVPFFISAQDGIPDNCEYDAAKASEFVRYEPQHRQLMLVNWATGDDIRVIASNLNDTIILGWSLDCHYLAGSVAADKGRDTIVWDVGTGEQMGSVPNAQYQSHHITWGPNDNLVVETRNGAILWHVPAYHQITLTTHYDPVNVRNFSRVRWDAKYSQLIANLSGGGRVVYDMQTGQEVPQVAEQTDAIAGDQSNKALMGGAHYDCRHRSILTDIRLRYNPNTHQIYIELFNDDLPEETLVVLENNITLASFHERNWTADCQYVAATLRYNGQETTNTVVWNVTTGKQVGIIPDARRIDHPIQFHPTQSVLLVETRNGAILWHLPTNQQFQLDTGATVPLVGASDVQNVTQVDWAENLLFITPVNAPDTIQVYDVNRGQLIQSTSLPTDTRYIAASPLGNHVLTCCTADDYYLVWNRAENQQIKINKTYYRYYSSQQFSPADNYLIMSTNDGVGVWHLNSLRPDGEPNVILSDTRLYYQAHFIDDNTFDTGEAVFNLNNGTKIADSNIVAIPSNHGDVEGESGRSPYYVRNGSCGGQMVYNGQTSDTRRFDDYTIYEGAEQLYTIQARYPEWSPGCKWIVGEIPYFEYTEREYTPPVDDTFREHDSEYVVFWDGETGEMVGSFYNPFRNHTYSHVSWSPDGNYAIVSTTDGSYLYHPASGTRHFLVMPDALDAFRTRFSTYWDFERGQVLVEGWSAVYSFDLNTGEWRFSFASTPRKTRCSYWGCGAYLPNSDFLVVGDLYSFSVWNLNTHQGYWLDFGDYFKLKIRPSRLRFSPSGRFVIKRFAHTLYVWDLQTISDYESSHLPYQVRLNSRLNYAGLTFIDDATVEIQVTNGENYTVSLLP